MATREIKTSIKLDGEKEFKKALGAVNSELKTLKSEMALVDSKFKGNANSTEALTAKQKILKQQYDQQEEKVKALNRAYNEAKEVFGENSAKADEYKQKLNYATIALDDMGNELKQNEKYLDEAKNSTDGCAKSIDKFGKETKQTGKEIEDTGKKSSRLADIFKGGFFANIASNAVSQLKDKLVQLTREVIDSADRIGTLSEVTGISTERLQELEFAGVFLDVELETLTGSLKKLINNMSAAKKGTGDAYEAFKLLGVQITDGNGRLRDSETVMGEVIDALGKMSNETERDAAAQDIFGKSATELNPMIKAGSKALGEYTDMAQKFGGVMSEDAINALDWCGDSWDALKISVKNAWGEFAAVQPSMQALISAQRLQAAETEQTFIPAVEDLKASIEGLNAEYEAAKETIQATLDSIVDGWSKMPETVKISADEVIKNQEEQLLWIATYRDNLDTLLSRKVPGVDMSALVKSFDDGTTQGAAMVAMLANSTDDEIIRMNANFAGISKGTDALAGSMAAAKIDYDKRMAGLVESTQKTISEDMNLSDEAKVSAVNTINGYINGVRGRSAVLNLTMTQAAQSAMNAWKSALDEHSPSRKMMESGENTIKGAIIGVEAMRNDLSKAYSDAANMAQLSFNSVRPESFVRDSRQSVNHTGTIRVEGVSNSGELIGAYDIIVEQLRREARM